MRTRRWVLRFDGGPRRDMPIAAQERGGQRGGAPAGAGPAMTLTIAGFPDGGQIPVRFSQAAEGAAPAKGRRRRSAGPIRRPARSPSCSTCTTWTSPATRRPTIRRTGSCGTFRRRPPACPKACPRARNWPDGSYQISATGPMYRGPGAPANGPLHHYMFELFALDTKLDVQPTADAFETRANVLKAMQGHILGKAVYGGIVQASAVVLRTSDTKATRWTAAGVSKIASMNGRSRRFWSASRPHDFSFNPAARRSTSELPEMRRRIACRPPRSSWAR